MNLLPKYQNGIVDGEYIHALPSCTERCNSKKCVEFYRDLKSKPSNCFYCCPFGMSTYLSSTGEIFTCFRNKSIYSKKKQPYETEVVYNPPLPQAQLLDLINLSQKSELDQQHYIEKKKSIDSIEHEVKQLNSQIKSKSDLLLQTYHLDEDGIELSPEDIEKLQESIRTIYVASSLVESRFALANYEKDKFSLSNDVAYQGIIHNKFYKMKKIFTNYQRRNVPILLEGSSYAQIMMYSSFDMIPMLIVENAVKYTVLPELNPVVIKFHEPKNQSIVVTISSYGPYCSDEDAAQIFNKGFRGKNAQRFETGAGIGLFFVKLLCELHDIKISAASDKSKIMHYNGIAVAPFTVSLEFHNVITE